MKISSFRVAFSLAAIFAAVFSANAQFTKLNAAGSTFAAPIMQRWSEEFSKANPNVQIIYLAVGSGIGVTNFTEGIVDFAASDAAMTDEQIAKVKQGVVLIPFTAGQHRAGLQPAWGRIPEAFALAYARSTGPGFESRLPPNARKSTTRSRGTD